MTRIVLKGMALLMVISTFMGLPSCKTTATDDPLNSENNSFNKDDSLGGACYISLLYMREEEKLAHDVYVNMYDLWNVKIFDNISKSETVHTNAVLGLLNLYGIDDPALPGTGEFSNSELQELYNTLIESGNVSLIEALKVGALIEETDIHDLDESIENCSVDTVITVYQRLRMGSTHHLKAFVKWLASQGITYEPQVLTQEEFEGILNGDGHGGHNGGGCHGDTTIVNLSEEETAGLLYMREEEKLAHDVYVNMYDLWNVQTFLNISKSETHHADAVLSLLEYYGLDDPALPGIGEFSNPDLQSLYDQLMVQGSDSLVAGLIVGATIEEVDILDLFERMDQTENTKILNVYHHLEKGSEAHLRAFVYQLLLNGYDYEPQFLTQEQFDEIMGN